MLQSERNWLFVLSWLYVVKDQYFGGVLGSHVWRGVHGVLLFIHDVLLDVGQRLELSLAGRVVNDCTFQGRLVVIIVTVVV